MILSKIHFVVFLFLLFSFVCTVPLFRQQYASMKDKPSTSDATVTTQADMPTKPQFPHKKITE